MSIAPSQSSLLHKFGSCFVQVQPSLCGFGVAKDCREDMLQPGEGSCMQAGEELMHHTELNQLTYI